MVMKFVLIALTSFLIADTSLDAAARGRSSSRARRAPSVSRAPAQAPTAPAEIALPPAPIQAAVAEESAKEKAIKMARAAVESCKDAASEAGSCCAWYGKTACNSSADGGMPTPNLCGSLQVAAVGLVALGLAAFVATHGCFCPVDEACSKLASLCVVTGMPVVSLAALYGVYKYCMPPKATDAPEAAAAVSKKKARK